ncbi:SKI family transcriptional corepressor 1 -like protein-B [Takifugu flavidus]|uniref:SKI family transcriptional corepressor 1-like protein-B n=1 Tax=Takifugu flavidus TaxID=433684 RepID=A0A5C6NK74_9TELE|nr:SKI family transcriptional corepressor 1 -like protein-B [Takifugu flavidus]
MRNGSPLHEVYAHEKGALVLLTEPPFETKQSTRSEGVHHLSEPQNQRNLPSQQEPNDRPADGSLRIDISVHERDLENMAKETQCFTDGCEAAEGGREGGAEARQHPPLLPAPQRCWDGATPADENNVLFLVVAPPEELQKQLVEQVELRKKLEREFQHLKDNFQDQMKRELSYREEMVQQLQIVREAHDALHHFSCKMLTPRQCSGACAFKPPLLPP